jgi:hypothetical protein
MPHQPFPARQLSRIGLTPDEIPPKVCARRAHRAASLTGRLRVDDGQVGSNPKVRFADKPPGISVSLQVEHKQFIGNGHLIDSSLR